MLASLYLSTPIPSSHPIPLHSTQHHTTRHQRSIKTQLQLAQSRLAAYEALEEEIDGAVLRVAQAGSLATTSDSSAPADATTADFIMSMRSVPSHPERRARQAVLLAQRLLDMEKQRDVLRGQLTDKTAAGVALQRQLDVAKEALARTSQVSFVEER